MNIKCKVDMNDITYLWPPAMLIYQAFVNLSFNWAFVQKINTPTPTSRENLNKTLSEQYFLLSIKS